MEGRSSPRKRHDEARERRVRGAVFIFVTPTRIHTTATVHLEKVGEGFNITKIDLNTEAQIPNIDAATFAKFADDAKKGCPVSKVLAAAQISLNAKLV